MLRLIDDSIRKKSIHFLKMNSPRLRVSPDGRRLLFENGTPFFYLADTAWEIFHRLTFEEAEMYLTARAEQGFNVIQAVILAELDGLGIPNPNGDVPLFQNDPTRPNEAYFAHVDRIIRRGAELGLQWGLLPTWGDKWNLLWGAGPEIFTPENARIYGVWLGRRYRDAPVIWVLGGDRPIQNERHLEIQRAMADGLQAGDDGNHLRTFHPWSGATSAQWVHNEPWLDFNMLQSGHTSQRLDNHAMIARDYAQMPPKPCLDSEPPYEDHPDMLFPRDLPAPYIGDLLVRRAAYQAVFAGACGTTYGCHAIWQFFDVNREPLNRPRTFWREALHLPGANQMRHLRILMEDAPFEQLTPDNSLISTLPSGEPAQALRAHDGTFALIYFPNGGTRTLHFHPLAGDNFEASWFDPRTGKGLEFGQVKRVPWREITPPDPGPDWVLALRAI